MSVNFLKENDMGSIQKLIDSVRPVKIHSLREERLQKLCAVAQKELDKLNSQSMCLTTTEEEYWKEKVK